MRFLAAGDNAPEPGLDGVQDRFMIDGADTDDRFAHVQHLFAPKALAAPMHRHHDEDEYTFVLTGRIGAVIEGTEVVAEPGDLLFKLRGQWHTLVQHDYVASARAPTGQRLLSGPRQELAAGGRHRDALDVTNAPAVGRACQNGTRSSRPSPSSRRQCPGTHGGNSDPSTSWSTRARA